MRTENPHTCCGLMLRLNAGSGEPPEILTKKERLTLRDREDVKGFNVAFTAL